VRRQLVAASIFTLAFGVTLGAATAQDVLDEYRLTSWGPTQGLTSGAVQALAQDAAGYLWLGTETGLVRFDGVRFTPWTSFGVTQLPRVPIRTLRAARDGSLWIGFGFSRGVSRLQNGQVQNYTERDGLPPTDVSVLVQGLGGDIWAGTAIGLFRFSNQKWRQWPGEPGLPPGPVSTAFVDTSGSLFIGTTLGIFRLKEGQEHFEQVEIFDKDVSANEFSRAFGGDLVRSLVDDRSGALWVTDPIAGFRRASTRGPLHGSRGAALVRDGKDNMWVGTWAQGLWRVHVDDTTGAFRIDRTTAADGLLGDAVRSLFEDREGNLWVGTLDGLNRLSPSKVTSITNIGVVGGIGDTPDGSMWVGTANDLIEYRTDGAHTHDVLHRLTPTLYNAIDTDHLGNVWVATRSDLIVLRQGHRMPEKLTGLGGLRQITLIASDRLGGCWLYDLDQGLFHWADDRLEASALPPDLRTPRIVAIYVDGGARLWLSLTDGRLATIDRDGQIAGYGVVGDVGVHRAMYQDSRGTVWLGGSEGITWFRQGRFGSLRRTDAFPLDSVDAIVEDNEGSLWLGTASGIIRIRREDFERAAASPSSAVRHGFYDISDGLAGTPKWFGKRSAARAPDGRLWFLTTRGVTIIDPHVLPASRPPYPVKIESVIADGQRLAAVQQMSLAARTVRLEIDYEVPTLTSPLKTRFRYRLEGFDSDWNYAGTGRQAIYTNVPPGDYRFQVMAGDSEGSWAEPGAALAFGIEPRFYQTAWFLLGCIAGLVAMVASAWRLHLRQVRKQFAIILGERVRLSREIHDTLLQSLVGVALQCDAIANELEPARTSSAREQFNRLRRDVEDHVREARQTIWNLRSPVLEQHDLATALQHVGRQASVGSPISFQMVVKGTPRRCSSEAEVQLLRIGQEAVVNAVRHSSAQHVRTELVFDEESITLRVEDDGVGFVPERLVPDADDHYGLVSMKERAETVGGRFNLSSGPGRGTVVEVLVPSPSGQGAGL
jgi:signal transduction histidine kinase/ligand-binding sensor domain-containing protein